MDPLKKPLILNVDDVEEAQYAKSRILRAARFSVIEAATGTEALKMVSEHSPDLVLLDVKLPDMSGIEVCRQIKSDPNFASVLVLQTSAHFTDSADKVRGLSSGADSYLPYPIEADELIANVTALLRLHRAQDQLRFERDQSQYLFDSMSEGFALLDRDWNVLRMNAEGLRISQRSAQEVIGRNHWEIWPELKGTGTEVLYRRVKETHKAESTEIFHILPDGSQVWIEVRAYPTRDGGLAFFFRDITDFKTAQEQLNDAVRRKDEFLAMLAHELRNPLAPIGAAAELLQLVELDRERVRQTSEIIARQVDHMTSLVEDLLDVSRVTRGLVKLDNASLDIKDIVTDALEQVTPLIRSRRHHLRLHLSPDATIVTGDRKRLVQLMSNLINNAAKYTPEGGNIMVKTDLQDHHVLLEVIDDGIGMEPELVERVFDLFAQAERTSDRSSGGLGLGLALVKSLTELHGGTVSCSSEGIGKGSRFIVCLPRLTQVATQPSQRYSGSQFLSSHQPLRIMIVDDNVDAAVMLRMLLEASGHQVIVEHDAKRALERAKGEVPDVFLLDIGLPEMDGNELAQHLRACPETGKATLIAITGYGQEQDRKLSMSAGFDQHLVKPVDTRKLAAVLSAINKN